MTALGLSDLMRTWGQTL